MIRRVTWNRVTDSGSYCEQENRNSQQNRPQQLQWVELKQQQEQHVVLQPLALIVYKERRTITITVHSVFNGLRFKQQLEQHHKQWLLTQKQQEQQQARKQTQQHQQQAMHLPGRGKASNATTSTTNNAFTLLGKGTGEGQHANGMGLKEM